MTPSVGIIGAGFVGTAVYKKFRYLTDVKVYDTAKVIDAYDDVIAQDVLFVCVPTPEDSDGKCDCSIVHSVLSDIDKKTETHKAVIIKSTVPHDFLVSTMDFQNLTTLYSPEFLTERMADRDFAMQDRIILGCDGRIPNIIFELFERTFPGIRIRVCSYATASVAKYAINTYGAVKVSFFNELFQIAHGSGVDWAELYAILLGDGRIAPSWSQVPGPDGEKGFGGKCLPKDLKGFIKFAESMGIDPKMLKAALEKNNEVR